MPQKGWTAACQLRAGDILVTVNGEYVVVEQIQHELLESPETTYNFEVADFHTYYVGNAGVLVHNTCDYQAPQGGGGTSDTVNVGNQRITFGHGGRHLPNNISMTGVNNAIARDVVNQPLIYEHAKSFDICYQGYNIEYRAIRLAEDWINVGTYVLQIFTS